MAAGGLALALVNSSLGQEAEVVPSTPLNPDRATNISTSTSGQFSVIGDSLDQRGALAFFAEEIKSDYLSLLSLRDSWRYPIMIQVTPAEPGRGGVRTRLEEIEGAGFVVRIFVGLNQEFSRTDFRRELLRALVTEQILRPHQRIPPGAAKRKRISPPWLLAGISEALTFRKGARPTDLFESILAGGRLLEVGAIFSGDPAGMDSVSRAVFEASAGALVLMLLDQPEGSDRFNKMIGRLGEARSDGAELLESSFPGLRTSVNSMEKWWSLQVASMAQGSVLEPLGPKESELRLAQALVLHYAETFEPEGAGTGGKERKPWSLASLFRRSKGDGKAEAVEPELEDLVFDPEDGAAVPTVVPVSRELADFAAVIGRDDREAIVRNNQLALVALEQRAFPPLRPVIAEYLDVFSRIGKGKPKGLADRIAALEMRRRELVEGQQRVEEYLDWFEATQQTSRSGAFDNYHEALKEIRKDPPRRNDPISRYLDAMEAEMAR
ncbi:hypothetical protein BH23VER1_BH23VER1_18180 [soil metagenome]